MPSPTTTQVHVKGNNTAQLRHFAEGPRTEFWTLKFLDGYAPVLTIFLEPHHIPMLQQALEDFTCTDPVRDTGKCIQCLAEKVITPEAVEPGIRQLEPTAPDLAEHAS